MGLQADFDLEEAANKDLSQLETLAA
jgi:hypothetical protein